MDSFFNAKSARSEAKARIVAKYFHAWAQVVRRAAKLHSDGRLAYVDLFAGPGRYLDGSKSTPLLILKDAVKDADLSQMLISIFNDIDRGNTHSLANAIEAIPGIKFKTPTRDIFRRSRRTHRRDVREDESCADLLLH